MRVCPRCGHETEAAACPHDGATTVTVSTAVATYPNGTVVADRYRIEEVLGIGGFGAVYRCTQLAMDQVVAVKVLKSEHIKSEEHVKRFAREAQAASKLSHPNTIRIFDFGSHTDDALYLAMEFLEGETLAQRLDRDHQIPPAQVVHILSQICHSLTEAHGASIIHRDLKPENIMLMRVAGDASFVKVLDFGIAAKLADAEERDEKLTEIGMIMGTPTYMSPEQAHGKPLDERSDIYALGVLMYEALTGRVPFDGDQPMTVLVKHINDPPVPPREVAPEAGISYALEKVVLRCLEKEPVLRPQTCAELAELLGKALEQPDGGLVRGRAKGATEAAAELLATEPLEELPATGKDPFATQAVPAGQRPASRGGFASPVAPRSRTPLWLGLGAFAVVGAAAIALALVVPTKELGSQDARRPSIGAPAGSPAGDAKRGARGGDQASAGAAQPKAGAAAAAPSQPAAVKVAAGGAAGDTKAGGPSQGKRAPGEARTGAERPAQKPAGGRAHPSKAAPAKAGTTKVAPSKARPTKAGPAKAGGDKTNPGSGNPANTANPDKANPAGAAKPAAAKPAGSKPAAGKPTRKKKPTADDFRLPPEEL